MALGLFLLVLFSAVLHATLNFAMRRLSGHIGVFWLGHVIGGLCCLPFAIYQVLYGVNDWSLLRFTLGSASFEAIFILLLAEAYRSGELSQVYPVARGTGVAGTSVVAAIFLGEVISPNGLAGISTVALGILLMAVPGLFDPRHRKAVIFSILCGATISGYSIMDKVAVGGIHPLICITIMFLGASLLMAPYVLIRARVQFREAFTIHLKSMLYMGPLMVVPYLLILFAFQQGNASYIVPVREFSVVIASFLGFFILKERPTRYKWAAIVAITVGLVLIKLA